MTMNKTISNKMIDALADRAILKSAEEENIELGIAIKNISEEKLRDIISGKVRLKSIVFNPETGEFEFVDSEDTSNYEPIAASICAGFAEEGYEESSSKSIRARRSIRANPEVLHERKRKIRPWMWQAASIAAVVVIAVVTVLKVHQNSNDTILQIQRESNFAVENTLVAYNYVSSSRDGIEMKDISNMSQDELKVYIPTLQTAYDNAPNDDIQECQVAGMNLAMAYLKLHEREKTITLLNELKSRFSFDEDYVAKCNKIISLLQ